MIASLSRRRRDELLLLALALGCLGLAWAFAKLGSEVLEGELLAVDRAAQRWIALRHSGALRAAFRVTTFFGEKGTLVVLGVGLGWWLFRHTRAAPLLLAFAAVAVAEFVGLLKRGFHVTRPSGGIAAGMGFSFPSGHTTGTTAVAVLFGYVALRQRVHPRIIVPACLLLAVLVGISRVYLDVHWASDVIGGWIVGAAFGVGCCAVYEVVHRRIPDNGGKREVGSGNREGSN